MAEEQEPERQEPEPRQPVQNILAAQPGQRKASDEVKATFAGLAFVWILLAVKHNWIGSLLSFAKKPAATVTTVTQPTSGVSGPAVLPSNIQPTLPAQPLPGQQIGSIIIPPTPRG